jgi:hypothetical protein
MMLRFTYLLVAGIFAFNTANAQSHQDQKGPSVKNYKPWEQQARSNVLVVNELQDDIKGPAYKNQRPDKSQSTVKNLVNTQIDDSPRVTGPKAKNRRKFGKN